jgi:predicted DNA-binding transcriptional regulator AlpA
MSHQPMSAAAAEPPAAYTIKQFCEAHGISVPTFYELRKRQLAPAEMRMGAVVRISREAAARWRAARENPGKAEAEESARTAKAMQTRARKAAKRAVASPLHVSRRAASP